MNRCRSTKTFRSLALVTLLAHSWLLFLTLSHTLLFPIFLTPSHAHTIWMGLFQNQALHFDQESEKHNSLAIITVKLNKQKESPSTFVEIKLTKKNLLWEFSIKYNNCPSRRWTVNLHLLWMVYLYQCSSWRQIRTVVATECCFCYTAFPTNKLKHD